MILVIGHASQWDSLARALPIEAELRFVAFRALSCDLLRNQRPDLVVCRLIDPGYDAAEVARLLAEAGFDGRFWAVCHPVPNPDLVTAEIKQVLGEIEFELVMVSGRLS